MYMFVYLSILFQTCIFGHMFLYIVVYFHICICWYTFGICSIYVLCVCIYKLPINRPTG